MSLFALYFTIHVLLMIGIIALCVVTGMPTRYWRALAAWGRQRWLRGKAKKLQKALAVQGADFASDESFLERGVGLAIDHTRGLVFLAQPEGKQYQSAILPKSQLGAHATVIRQEEGFHHCFVEIEQTEAPTRKWLLPCADSDLADEINERLSQALC